MTAPFDKQGHRGCRGLMPENIIPAMLKAIDLGITTLEIDVVITADSEVLLSHEPFFSHEITTKADGSPVKEQEEKMLNIFKMTYAETQAFDVGLKPHPRFPQQQKMAVHKPRLADLIDSVEAYLKKTNSAPVAYNIETKTKAITDNIYHPPPDVFVRLLMNVIKDKGIAQRTIIQSFDMRTLQIVHRDYSQMQTALLVEDFDKKPFDHQLRDLGFTPSFYSPHYSLVNAELVKSCHEKGVKLLPWTVNDTKAIGDLKKLGVDGVITDYPNLFQDVN